MFKLMIVDDEPIVRIRLRETIDWAAINCEIVSEADDGIKALQEYEKTKPDIVITDIMMNNSDGLDFISAIRKKDQYTEIIILTAYENFNYAKRALENEVGAYILKPIQNEVIIKYVETAIKKIIKKQNEKRVIDEHAENVQRSKSMTLLDLKETVQGYSEITEKAVQYIRDNYSTVNVESLAAALFVSKRTLMRKFKQETGSTVGEFITEIRIQTAVEMVRLGEYKMVDVAQSVGYRDMKHFYETFKKVTGHSPKFYKMQ